ncbi:MAG: hypothetical protein J6W84_02025 [Bacteroidales bacterium]|nr:hypothetical protein [Bacteroidales bacterium]
MSKERDCATKLRAIVGKEPFQTFVAKVTKVDGATCTVLRLFDDMELNKVRLNCHSTENEGVVIVPKTGSMVLITSIDGRCWFVSQCSKVEKITIDATASPDGIVINGGSNYGLIKIKELTDKLNELVKRFNQHTHTGQFKGTIGSNTPVSGNVTYTAIPVQIPDPFFVKSDYEDTNIKH